MLSKIGYYGNHRVLLASASSDDKSSSSSLTIPAIAGLVIGIMLIFLLSVTIERAHSPRVTEAMTMTGTIECLPHKKNPVSIGSTEVYVETGECRMGFYSNNDGKYYALHIDDQKYYWLFSANQSNELVNVTGITRPALDSDNPHETCDITGIIDNISSVGTADGHMSIYEVVYAHNKQLSAILDKIHAKTGGGYSMGVDKECDDDNNGNNNHHPCIRITLEKDDPELRKQIPDQLEGFKVDVQVLNP